MPQDESVTIRPAARADLPALVALYRELESESSRVDLPIAESIFERIQKYPDYSIYLATEAGAVIGTFALLIMEAIGERCAPVGIVEDVVVARSARSRGIGGAMMRFAMDRCTAAGCYKIVLSSNARRRDAHRFYESLGFERHGYSFVVKLSRNDQGK
ncbi:MAG TPA: GNAT family N-acetyltransferase [Thermoanaerobaculia bacterium]|nr:GNAT family N-acetyltransferase [Thermoanaerobaculia bacterium]